MCRATCDPGNHRLKCRQGVDSNPMKAKKFLFGRTYPYGTQTSEKHGRRAMQNRDSIELKSFG